VTYKGGAQAFEFARVGWILTRGEYRFMKQHCLVHVTTTDTGLDTYKGGV